MHETKQKFYELSAKLLRESGLLLNRPTWIKLRQLVQTFDPELWQSEDWSATQQLLLALLKTAENSPERLDLLGKIFETAIKSTPDEEFILLLKQISFGDLAKSLLPCMYQTDSRGSAAVYMAARVQLHLASEAFQYFLCARLWTQTDLINLSFLVRDSEIQTVCAILEKASESEQSAVNTEAFSEFRYILFNRSSQEPLLPDMPPSSVHQQNIRSAAATPKLAAEPDKTLRQPVSESAAAVKQQAESDKLVNQEIRSVEIKRKPAPNLAPALQQRAAQKSDHQKKPSLLFPSELIKLVETNRTGFLILFALTAVTLLANFSGWLTSDSQAPNYSRTNTTKIPTHWVDSASKEQITERYLAADKDYRMGELYLTRDKYSEALILFEDALSIRPDHLQALYRVGYCRLNIKDYAGAKVSLEKALKINPGFRHANLLLAMVAIHQNDNKLAEEHFKLELELAKDPVIAIEYANFLQTIGKEVEAKSLINRYQTMYPERIMALSRTPANAEKQEQQQ